MKLFFWKKSSDPKSKDEINTQKPSSELTPSPLVTKKPIRNPEAIPTAATNRPQPAEERSPQQMANRSKKFIAKRKPNTVVKRGSLDGSFGQQQKAVTSIPSPKLKPQEVVIQEIAGPTQYKVLPIKRWCERELTPVAWARVLVRILPVLRQYGYSFAEMQNPAPDTRVKEDFFFVISATIQEIYEYTYEEPTAA